MAENTDNCKNQDSYIQNWLLTCDEQYAGLRTLLKSWEPGGHNNITNDDTSFEVAENTDKQKWMWFRHTDRLYGMTALLFFVYYIYKPYKVIHRSTFHTRKYILDFPNRFNALLILHVNVLILFITLTDSSKCWIYNNDLCIHIILIWFRPFWLCM